MSALWCDPWRVHLLPCGCAARQRDWTTTWVPLRPCGHHLREISWMLVKRTLPEARGAIFQTPLPLGVPPYEREVRCRCCGVRVDAGPCACVPRRCEAHDRGSDVCQGCAAHCQADQEADEVEDGHPEPEDDVAF